MDSLKTKGWFLTVLLVVFILGGCENAASEKEAQAIYENALTLQKQQRTVEALKEYDRLKEFKKTAVFKKAKAELQKAGFSIGSSLESWTIQQMYKVKNKLISQDRIRHPDGDVVVPLMTKDGWENYIRVQYSTGRKYAFSIISAGPDKKLNTDDDLRLIHEHKKTRKQSPATQHVKSDNRGSSKTAEARVDLKDLMGKN